MNYETQIWCDLYKSLSFIELNKRLKDVTILQKSFQNSNQIKALESLLKN